VVAVTPDDGDGGPGSEGFAELNRTLGAQLRGARLAQRMSLRDLAALTGISSGAIRTYENGERPVNIGRFLELCHALKVDPLRMLGGLEWRSAEFGKVTRVEPPVYRIDLVALESSRDPRLVPLKRWVQSQPNLRRSPEDGKTVLLEREVIPLLAEVLDLPLAECVALLHSVSGNIPNTGHGQDLPGAP